MRLPIYPAFHTGLLMFNPSGIFSEECLMCGLADTFICKLNHPDPMMIQLSCCAIASATLIDNLNAYRATLVLFLPDKHTCKIAGHPELTKLKSYNIDNVMVVNSHQKV